MSGCGNRMLWDSKEEGKGHNLSCRYRSGKAVEHEGWMGR